VGAARKTDHTITNTLSRSKRERKWCDSLSGRKVYYTTLFFRKESVAVCRRHGTAWINSSFPPDAPGSYLVTLTMISLALFSVYSLSVIGERWWTFGKPAWHRPGFFAACWIRSKGEVAPGAGACETRKGTTSGRAGVRPAEFLPLESANPACTPGRSWTGLAWPREAMQRATAAEIERWSSG